MRRKKEIRSYNRSLKLLLRLLLKYLFNPAFMLEQLSEFFNLYIHFQYL